MRKRHLTKGRLTFRPMRLDSTEFLLLAFVVVALLMVFGWQTGLLPSILTNSLVLGISTIR